jgi:AraC-like DNA-binding protein
MPGCGKFMRFPKQTGLAPWQLQFSRAIDFLEANPTEKPLLRKLATLVNLSASHFNRAFDDIDRSAAAPPASERAHNLAQRL